MGIFEQDRAHTRIETRIRIGPDPSVQEELIRDREKLAAALADFERIMRPNSVRSANARNTGSTNGANDGELLVEHPENDQ
jgi:hypothetical protein